MLAVIPVRRGTLPAGANETVAEAGGAALVVGEDPERAAAALLTATGRLLVADLGPFAVAAWSAVLAPQLVEVSVIVLPASPDGRDLAPRLAFVLGRTLYAGAVRVSERCVVQVGAGGRVSEVYDLAEPVVATLEPGARSFVAAVTPPVVTPLNVPPEAVAAAGASGGASADAEVLAVLPPEAGAIELAEAPRLVAGGAGLGGAEPFALLREVAAALGAGWGASRVAADAGWAPQERFIGTSGVTVAPRLYLAFGISGAMQHVAGLGHPDHIVAVNTDATAPIMAMADLAIVSDAVHVLAELAERLRAPATPPVGPDDGAALLPAAEPDDAVTLPPPEGPGA